MGNKGSHLVPWKFTLSKSQRTQEVNSKSDLTYEGFEALAKVATVSQVCKEDTFTHFDESFVRKVYSSFQEFDKDGDGRISANEVSAVLQSMGSNPTEEEVLAMMDVFDEDGDGTLSAEEFLKLNILAWRTNKKSSESDKDHLKVMFDLYDMNKDGLVSAEELFKVISASGSSVTLETCLKWISEVDADGDGSMSLEEFKKFMG